ncbi:MAG: peptidase m75, imelysin [Pseudarcicella sp.]|nr:peptidase m75, imelysin [Pseudarcicella sp.]
MKKIFLLSCSILFLAKCSSEEKATPQIVANKSEIVKTYSKIVLASYSDALEQAQKLNQEIATFTANPSAAGLEKCKQAWLNARPSYLQTEAYRFYSGPIDNDSTGVEGLLNAWPLDEAYIDYTKNNSYIIETGVINDSLNYPSITSDFLVKDNELNGETDVKVGYHAIEFLLWGQDESKTGPGNRPYTDYLIASNKNAFRRATYLKVVSNLLVESLQQVKQQWETSSNFRKEFEKESNTDASIINILIGLGKLSKGELAGERLGATLANKSQEDEHSCFSDNTHNDFIYNQKGINNVFVGSYTMTNGTKIEGYSFSEYLKNTKISAFNETVLKLNKSTDAIKNIPVPFDLAIESATGQQKITEAIASLKEQSNQIVQIAKEMGYTLIVPEKN